MSEIIVKSAPLKVDPKHPESHPGYKESLKKGARNLPKLKFENDAQKRDYEKAVKANPNNVMGLPVFYPPQTVGTFAGFSGVDFGQRMDMLPCGKRWANARYSESGEAIYRCRGCTCEGFKSKDLSLDKQ